VIYIKKNKICKTPTILQIEAVECGAVSLGIILAYHGRYEPIEDLRYSCSVSRDGSNALNILKAAKNYGLNSKGLKLNANNLKKIDSPAILFWGFNHFVVLEGYKNDHFYINDPASGHKKINEKDFLNFYSGVVLTFEKTNSFQKSKKNDNTLKSVKEIIFSNGKKVIIYLFLCGFLLSFLGILIPTFSRIFIDSILIPNNEEWLVSLMTVMLITAFFTGVVIWIKDKLLLKLETKISVDIASQFFYQIIKLPIKFFSQRQAGTVSGTMSSGDQISKIACKNILLATINLIFSSFYLIMMFYFDILLSLLAIIFTLLNVFAVFYSSKKIKEEYQVVLNDELKLSAIAVSGIQSIETIKATGQENSFFSKLVNQYSKLQNVMFQITKKELFLSSIPHFSQFLSLVMLILIGGLRIIDGSMTIGAFVAFKALNASFYIPVNRFANSIVSIRKFEADKKRLDDVLNYPNDEYLNRDENIEVIKDRLDGKIEIKNLTFGYDPFSEPLINNFNLTIKPSQRIALVGLSGSGKSTLGKLISGLLQPWSGEILFDSIPSNKIEKYLLTSSLSYIEQDVVLFEGTIKENITLWNKYISDENIIRAAKDASIHKEITSLINNYDYELQELGRNLSGGMRQRVEIARCLSNNPSILIMDEATSALDAKTELEIDLNIRKRGCTCIIISHRLSTIRDCDEIIVLQNGKVVERGKHEDLLKNNGLYNNLIEM